MNGSNYKEFSCLWKTLFERYKNKSPTNELISFEFELLKKYEVSQVRTAIISHLKDPDKGNFMPLASDIIRNIDGDAESRCYSAWSVVTETMKRKGPYDSLVFDDEKIMAVIAEMGGWIDLCAVTNKQLPFIKNEFMKRYKGHINSTICNHPNVLIGIIDAKKLTKGVEIKPILVGDMQKASDIFYGGSKKENRYNVLKFEGNINHRKEVITNLITNI